MLVELVMLSRFGRGDGGRETWAYGFIPRYLQANRDVRMKVLGFRDGSDENPVPELLSLVGAGAASRLTVRLLSLSRGRLPFLVKMICKMRTLERDDSCPSYTLGVGTAFEMLLIRYGRRRTRGKVVIWLRGILTHEKSNRIPRWLMPLTRLIEMSLLRQADLLLANGDDIAEHYRERGLDAIVVKNSVDITKWAADPPAMGARLKIGFVGRLAKVKGVEDFCRLVQYVKSRSDGDQFEFIVIGDGPYRKTVQVLESQGFLIYHGQVSNADLAPYLRALDVCVALTFSSPSGGGGGTSNALLEQMAAGRVILGWDNAHFRQLVDNSSAFLVPQGNVTALNDALHRIASDHDEARRRATCASLEAKKYGIDVQVRKFQDALLSIGIKH